MTKPSNECSPPSGTRDDTNHILSSEVGDGTSRETFTAAWLRGMWHTSGICALSPRKAAWATWRYEGEA